MRALNVPAAILAVLLAAAALAGCAGAPSAAAAHTAGSPEEFARLGLSPSRIEAWEDGARTDGGRGTYEWWYFDFSLDDGSTLVVVFLTKDFTRPGSPLAPVVTFSLDRAGGATVNRAVTAGAADFSAAKDRCDVRIGSCTAAGDLGDYAVHYEDDEVVRRPPAPRHGAVVAAGHGARLLRRASASSPGCPPSRAARSRAP